MKIYVCDKCKSQRTAGAITGSEFERHGFKTLTPLMARRYGVTDVCDHCFKLIEKSEREKDEAERRFRDGLYPDRTPLPERKPSVIESILGPIFGGR